MSDQDDDQDQDRYPEGVECECGGLATDRCDECRAPMCESCAMQGQWEARTICMECMPDVIAADLENEDAEDFAEEQEEGRGENW